MPPTNSVPNQSVVINYPRRQNPRKKLLVLAVAIGLALAVAAVIANILGNANISIKVANAQQGEIVYKFVNQADRDNITEISTADTVIEARLRKGTYELTVQQSGANFFSIVNVGQTDTLNASLTHERGRKFIGNIPLACSHIVEALLLSYRCGVTVDTLQTHVPATSRLPTHTTRTLPGESDVIEGLVATAGGQSILLLREAEVAGHEDFSGDGEHSPHIAFQLNRRRNGINLTNRTPLDGLSENAIYRLVPYMDGFIAYDEQVGEAYVFPGLQERASRALKLPDAGSADRRLVSAHRDFLVVTHVSEAESSSKVNIYKNSDNVATVEMGEAFFAFSPCGERYFCGLTNERLAVYELSEERLDLVFEIGGVSAFDNLGQGNQIVAVNGDGALVVDLDSRSGYLQYALGKYSFCGLQTADESYAVCVINPNGAESVLLIEQDQESDFIDQKVAELSSLPEVRVASTYDQFISISPDVGNVKYIEEIDGFGYDPATIRNANQAITKAINELGIDTDKYKISSTLGQL